MILVFHWNDDSAKRPESFWLSVSKRHNSNVLLERWYQQHLGILQFAWALKVLLKISIKWISQAGSAGRCLDSRRYSINGDIVFYTNIHFLKTSLIHDSALLNHLRTIIIFTFKWLSSSEIASSAELWFKSVYRGKNKKESRTLHFVLYCACKK